MITLKLKLKDNFPDMELIKQYNHVLRFSYNRFLDRVQKESDVYKNVKDVMSNIEKMDAFLISCAVKQGHTVYNVQKAHNAGNVIFGGNYNWKRYVSGLITKEEFEENRLSPMVMIGESNHKGNRKFELDLTHNRLIFKKSKTEHYDILFHEPSRGYRQLLYKFQELYDQDPFKTCFTVRVSKDYVWFVFDEEKIQNKRKNVVKGRIGSIDMNPNYIALVIQDSDGTMICKDLFSLKAINDFDNRKHYKNKEDKVAWRSHLDNKKTYEVLEIAKRIISQCVHYGVETFLIENLIKINRNTGKGKAYNKLCMCSWKRIRLFNNIRKRCVLEGIEFKAVCASYSSIKGQLENNDEIDSIAAAIEIGKRSDSNLKGIGDSKVDMGALSNRWKKEIESSFNHTPTWKEVSGMLKEKFKKSRYRNFFSESNERIRVSSRLKSASSHVMTYAFV